MDRLTRFFVTGLFLGFLGTLPVQAHDQDEAVDVRKLNCEVKWGKTTTRFTFCPRGWMQIGVHHPRGASALIYCAEPKVVCAQPTPEETL